jgi:hypothetical protein
MLLVCSVPTYSRHTLENKYSTFNRESSFSSLAHSQGCLLAKTCEFKYIAKTLNFFWIHFKIVETSWVYSMYSISDPFRKFIIFQNSTEHKCAIVLPLVWYFIKILR